MTVYINIYQYDLLSLTAFKLGAKIIYNSYSCRVRELETDTVANSLALIYMGKGVKNEFLMISKT